MTRTINIYISKKKFIAMLLVGLVVTVGSTYGYNKVNNADISFENVPSPKTAQSRDDSHSTLSESIYLDGEQTSNRESTDPKPDPRNNTNVNYVASACTKTIIPKQTIIKETEMLTPEQSYTSEGSEGYVLSCNADSTGYKPNDVKVDPISTIEYRGTKKLICSDTSRDSAKYTIVSKYRTFYNQNQIQISAYSQNLSTRMPGYTQEGLTALGVTLNAELDNMLRVTISDQNAVLSKDRWCDPITRAELGF